MREDLVNATRLEDAPCGCERYETFFESQRSVTCLHTEECKARVEAPAKKKGKK